MVKTHTWIQISQEFNYHPDAIRRIAKRLGLRKYILNKAPAARDMAIMAYSENHGCAKAAIHYKTTIDAIKSARRRVRKRRTKIGNAMNGVRFEKFKRACYKIAFKYGRGHLKDDFSSWATVKILEGRNSNIEQLWNDFQDLSSNQQHEVLQEEIVASKPSPQTRDLFALADSIGLSQADRFIFLLRYKDGLSQLEISKYLQLTESRICQILGNIKKLLEDKYL